MITYIIIGITVVVSYLCFSSRRMFMQLALIPSRLTASNEWYRLITHGFVHADMMHLLVNMFTCWSFGTFIEQYFKATGLNGGAYPGLYFGGMIAASVYDVVKRKNDPYYVSIGASGAVAAVLFSYILLKPFGMIYFFAVLPVPAILFGVLYLVYCQYMAKKGTDNINHNAHFYGAVYGFIYPLLLKPELLQSFFSQIRL